MSSCKWCGDVAVVHDGYGYQCASCWVKGAGNGKRKQTSSNSRQGKVRQQLGQNIPEGQKR